MKGYTTAEMKRFNYLISETNAVYHEAAQKLGLSDSTQQVLYTICNNGDSCPASASRPSILPCASWRARESSIWRLPTAGKSGYA